RRLLTLEIASPHGKYVTPAASRALQRTLLERIDRLPGVESSAAVLLRPLWGQVGMDWIFVVEGQAEADARRNPHLNLEAVTPGYFRAMRIPVRHGRTFDDTDAEGAAGVVVVGESFARRY